MPKGLPLAGEIGCMSTMMSATKVRIKCPSEPLLTCHGTAAAPGQGQQAFQVVAVLGQTWPGVV